MLFIDPTAAEWPDARSDYERDALTFCRAWRSDQSAFTLHTSGSTGTPKPIQLTRRQLVASARLTGKTFGLAPGDTLFVCLNIHYIAGVMMLVRGLELGLPMLLTEPAANPLTNFDTTDSPFAFTAFVPLQLQTILETAPNQLPLLDGCKAILVGGAATNPALERALQVITAPVYATYGMTETVSHIAIRRLNGAAKRATFSALAGVELGLDARGCLNIRAAATDFERIQTNDVADLITPTEFRLLGRADAIINSGGVKIQPERIERIMQERLAERGFTGRLFVAGRPDDRLGQRVVAFIEWPDDEKPLSDDQWSAIRTEIRATIGLYAVPKEVITVARFAETATGKVDKRTTMGLNA